MAKKKPTPRPLPKPSLARTNQARLEAARYHADKANRVLTGPDHAQPEQIARGHAHAMAALALLEVAKQP
jgi:hypothetical protein